MQEILSVYWSLGLTSTRFLKSRAVTVYLLQEKSTNTKNPVDTRTVRAGLGPSYPVHCVYIMGVVKLPNSKSEEENTKQNHFIRQRQTIHQNAANKRYFFNRT